LVTQGIEEKRGAFLSADLFFSPGYTNPRPVNVKPDGRKIIAPMMVHREYMPLYHKHVPIYREYAGFYRWYMVFLHKYVVCGRQSLPRSPVRSNRLSG
jgi:hypothetical protein